MARLLENKTNVTAPDVDYPYGRIRDKTPLVGGTPVNEEVYGDFHQFFAKMLSESGITPNDLPESAYAGFQYFQALLNVAHTNISEDIIKGLLGSYTTNDLIILHGCIVSATIPGSSTITAGAIYYNGKIYKVPAATVVTAGSETLVFKINTSEEPNFIYLIDDLTGTGIANYNGATVKKLRPDYIVFTPLNSWALGTFQPKYRKLPNGVVEMAGNFSGVLTPTNSNAATLPAGYRPSGTMVFPAYGVVSGGAEIIGRITITSAGVMTFTSVTGGAAFDSTAVFGVDSVRFNVEA